METLETLSDRLATAQEIRGIVRAMKALSSASIRQYELAAEAMAEYERTVSLGLQAVLRSDPAGSRPPPPAAARAQGARGVLVVVGSDRGLCGRFNDRIAAAARDRLAHGRGPPGGHGPLLCVLGLRAAARLEAGGVAADRLYTLPGSVEGLVGKVQSVARDIDGWLGEGHAGRVELLHNRRAGAALAEPTLRTLLPMPRAELEALARAPWPSPRLPAFRMERDRLLAWLTGQHLFVVLYRALAESLASEHAARLAAMQGAERNIDARREEMLGTYRRLRQETITRELLDVVAGFEAARGRNAGT